MKTHEEDQEVQFLQLTHLVLDGEATAAEQKDFHHQLASSVMCQEELEQEKAFIDLIRKSIPKEKAPQSLVENISQAIQAEVQKEEVQDKEVLTPMSNY